MKLSVFPHNRISPLATMPLALLTACCFLAGQTPVARASDSDAVLPPKSHPFGKSYTQWSEEHWRWTYSIPAANHPAFQDGNIDLSQYQPPGHVWFLIGSFSPTPVASGFSATADRTATVPHGKALFFPIIDAEASTAEGNGSTHADLLAAAKSFLDPVSGLVCEIDGHSVQHLERYRFETPLFTWGPVPADNILSLPAGTTTASVSAGYFLMLAPLSTGAHTLHFTGTSGVSPNAFTLDITYHLTVVGKFGGNDEDDEDRD